MVTFELRPDPDAGRTMTFSSMPSLEPQCSEPKRKIRRLITFEDGTESSKTNIHSNCSKLNFDEAVKVFGSSRNWIMSATNFNDYFNVMCAIKSEFKKDTNTRHIIDKKLPKVKILQLLS